MGDWAKGEFAAKGLKAEEDYLCIGTPAPQTIYQFVSDVFVYFKNEDETQKAASMALAEAVMDPKVQHDFNIVKGSLPSRADVDMKGFDKCSLDEKAALEEASKNNTLLGNLSNTSATSAEFTAVFSEVGAKFFVSNMSSQEAVDLLVSGIANAR
jgi:glucose/mannose transport system substrate-binding protein